MELLYVWIKDYKNIKEQGFNFSPKWRFDYDPETGVLDVEDQSDKVIDNFFGEHISNVTAIVGENGSGKSNVIENLLYRLSNFDEGGSVHFDMPGNLLVFENLIFTPENIPISNQTELQKKGYKLVDYESDKSLDDVTNGDNCEFEEINKTICAYYSNHLDGRALPYFNLHRLIDISVNGLINHDFSQVPSWSWQNNDDMSEVNVYGPFLGMEVKRQLDFISSKIKELPIKLPNALRFMFTRNRLFDITSDFAKANNLEKQVGQLEKWNEGIWWSPEGKTSSRFKKRVLYYFIRALLIDFPKEFSNLEIESLDNWFYRNKYPHFKSNGGVGEKVKFAEKYFKILDELFASEKTYFFPEKDSDVSDGSEINYGVEIFLVNPQSVEKVKELHECYLGLSNKGFFSFAWEGMSSGERGMLNLFSRIYSIKKHPKFEGRENLFLVIDEGDMGFHPQWQKTYFADLLDIISKIFSEITIQFLLIAHSPFILSDLPKGNVIFLKKGEDGTCQVADGLNEMKQTFGANIHTLLSDGFFMDGLMGDFAKEKIDKVIRYLNDQLKIGETMTEGEATKTIGLIGEPILKRDLERQMDIKKKKKADDNEIKINALEKRVQDLENALKKKNND